MFIVKENSIKAAESKKNEELTKNIHMSLRKLFPTQTKESTDNEILLHIDKKRKDCNKLKIITEQGIFSYICIGFLLGEGIYKSKGFLELFQQDFRGDDMVELFYFTLKKSL